VREMKDEEGFNALTDSYENLVRLTVVCPLCRSDDVEVLPHIPAIVLCKCQKCRTAFTITPAPPNASGNFPVQKTTRS